MKDTKVIFIVSLVAVFLISGLGYYFWSGKVTRKDNIGKSPTTYNLVAISKHANQQDCWFAVENKVYNVTDFIASARHPGGAAILQGCGKDASTLFKTRPMGSGTPHSPKAMDALKNYYIGELVE